MEAATRDLQPSYDRSNAIRPVPTATQDSRVERQTTGLEQVREAAAAAEWLVLVGSPDGELVEAALACGGPVLVVLPEGGVLGALQEQGYGPWPERLSSCEALLTAEAGEVCWYSYNDPRRNGPTAPEQLEPLVPNLKLERLELRPSRTLAQVLQTWGEATSDQGLLVLAEGDPQAVLAGAGAWLANLAALLLAPGLAASWESLDALLQPQALARPAQDLTPGAGGGWTLWNRNERLLSQRQLAELSDQRDGLLQQREALKTQVEELQGQLTAQSAQTAEQSQQREALQARVEDLQGQHTALSMERDQLLQARDALQNQVQTQQERFDRINIELDEVLTLIDQDHSGAQEFREIDAENV